MVGIVAYALETQGFTVITAFDGQQALEKVEQHHPDLLVLDVMLPKVNGFEICRQVRQRTTIPVILLTARKEDEDIIQGLELGADDYITKPFNPRTLALRAQAVLRRCGWGKLPSEIQVADLVLDVEARQVHLAGRPVALTANEFDLLLCLVSHAGRVLSWESLLKEAWQIETWEGGKEMVKTAVYRLRQKIEVEPESPQYIQTVRGVGYVIQPNGQ